jgi:hypothetical protein
VLHLGAVHSGRPFRDAVEGARARSGLVGPADGQRGGFLVDSSESGRERPGTLASD